MTNFLNLKYPLMSCSDYPNSDRRHCVGPLVCRKALALQYCGCNFLSCTCVHSRDVFSFGALVDHLLNHWASAPQFILSFPP